MSKEYKPIKIEDLEKASIERKNFNTKEQMDSLDEEAIDMHDLAIEMVKKGVWTISYEVDNSVVKSVTIKNADGKIKFFSENTYDIDDFMLLKQPE